MTSQLLEERIESNLRSYGFPMFTLREGVKSSRIQIENLIISILAKNDRARFVYSIPVLIAKNSVNYAVLLEKAISAGIQNVLGWIIEETINSFESLGINKDLDKLRSLIKKIPKDTSDHYVSLDQALESDRLYGLERRSDIAAKWNVITGHNTADFTRILRAYTNDKKEHQLQKPYRSPQRTR